ncbi:hypothetical protein ACLB1E_03160 [Escherichia coli]
MSPAFSPVRSSTASTHWVLHNASEPIRTVAQANLPWAQKMALTIKPPYPRVLPPAMLVTPVM